MGPGDFIGPYRVDVLLGAGGMGEVYRARDTKLNRDVAIKILPAAFVGEPERLARFKREAQMLASLNHPNIAAIHGLEDSGGTQALVLELVEGPTLADRTAHGPIPLDEAMPIARQIADALEAAHEQGIIHRDLKPANIKVREDGTVKVLDFGLAKLAEAGGTSQSDGVDLSRSPTITTPAMTAAGMILGTAAYMSPEQAKGRPADKRSDIWAFGCVFYELLSGRRAFEADDVTDTLAAVLRSEPDWSAVPLSTPQQITALIRGALTKNRSQRIGDIAVAKFVLAHPENQIPQVVDGSARRRPGKWVVWGLAALAIAWFGFAAFRLEAPRAIADRRVIRATIDPPPRTSFLLAGGLATIVQVSPDGNQIVFATGGPGSVPRLWLRSIDAADARPLLGTETASSPFWSPDSKQVAFFQGRRLMRLDIRSETLSSICELPGTNGRGGTWNQSGDIVFSIPDDRRLYRVRADGGVPTPLTLSNVTDRDLDLYPKFLPDGRHFLFLRNSIELARQGLYVGSLDSSEITFVVKSRWNGAVVGSQLLYLAANSTALVVQSIDLARFVLTGSPQRLADQIAVSGPGLGDSRAQFSVSENGLLAYHRTLMSESQLTWVDRTGRVTGIVGTAGSFANPKLSPDGAWLAVDHWDAQRGDTHIWLFDLGRGTSTPVKTGDGTDSSAVWSPDGSELGFLGAFEDAVRLYSKNLRTDQVTRLADLEQVSFPTSWSPDGTLFLAQNSSELDLMALERGAKSATVFAGGPGVQVQGEASPDGKLVAYNSSEGGTAAVYVQPRSGGAKVRASTDVSNDPHWSSDGNQLFFGVQNTIMQTDVMGPRDGRVQLGAPKPVVTLQPRRGAYSFSNPFPASYAVANNGQRFLYLVPTDAEDRHPMTIVVNWQTLLNAGGK